MSIIVYWIESVHAVAPILNRAELRWPGVLSRIWNRETLANFCARRPALFERCHVYLDVLVLSALDTIGGYIFGTFILSRVLLSAEFILLLGSFEYIEVGPAWPRVWSVSYLREMPLGTIVLYP